MIEVMKGQDRIPCDTNADIEKLVAEHGAGAVLVDGISVAEIAERAAIEAAAEAEAAEVAADAGTPEPAVSSQEVADNIVEPAAAPE